MAGEHIGRTGWLPHEESVLNWHEQIELSFRRRDSAVRQVILNGAHRRQAQSSSVAESEPRSHHAHVR